MLTCLLYYYFAFVAVVSVNANNEIKNKFTTMDEWKKEMIENAGCPFVSPDQMLVTNVCFMPYYRSNQAPFEHLHTKTQVNIDLYEVAVLEINEKKKKLTVKISQHLAWVEPRIRANFSGVENDIIKLSSDNFFQIWQPDVDLYSPNLIGWESLYAPRLYKDIVVYNGPGNITKLSAWKDWKASMYCAFNFSSFPFDTHVCEFLQLADRISTTRLFYFPQNTTNTDHDATGFNILISLVGTFVDEFAPDPPNGSHHIGFNMKLKRIRSPYIYKYYLPCAAIVLVSQISFTIPISSIPGRVSLVVTQFLTLTNIFIYQMVSTYVLQNTYENSKRWVVNI